MCLRTIIFLLVYQYSPAVPFVCCSASGVRVLSKFLYKPVRGCVGIIGLGLSPPFI